VTDFEHQLRELVREVVREELARVRGEPATSGEYLSTGAAAQIAGVHPGTIRRWIREGRLAEHRAGRVVRVLRSELEQLMRSGHHNGPRDLTDAEIDAMASRIGR
jgi:excisionase family DNA binding protein